jgi:Nickel responsive protein SCO4226-like
MPRYMIERTVPGAGQLSPGELGSIATRSCEVLKRLGTRIQWVESFVTDDKIYCVYLATDPELIRRHGRDGEFPVDCITEVRSIISPDTATRAAEANGS